MHPPSAPEPPQRRVRPDWEEAVQALPEPVLRRAAARPTGGRILSICRPSEGFPASTRPISSPRIIYGSCPLAMTGAGSRGTRLGGPLWATGNGAAIGRLLPDYHLRRDS